MQKEQYIGLLSLKFEDLIQKAFKAKMDNRGPKLSLCTIMNVKSGACTEDCAFCAQSARYKTGAPVYPLVSEDKILKQAEAAKESGASRFSLVASGKGPSPKEVDYFAEIVSKIKTKIGINVCASLGIMDLSGLKVLKQAGLTRYHHNLETCKTFFPSIVSTHDYEARVNTIKQAQEAGLEVCAGGIIGLGETPEHRLELALELKSLKVNSVPLNFLIPIEGTPLYNASVSISPLEAIKTIAIFRITMPDVALRLAAGRESLLKDFLALAFYAGADSMMIGGYLTKRGRPIEEDQAFCKEIKKMWADC